MTQNNPFQFIRRSYERWDREATPLMETMLKNPFLTGTAGNVLNASARLVGMQRRVVSQWWSALGLPTRDDQERLLHAVHELQSRIIDLEDKLAEERRERARLEGAN